MTISTKQKLNNGSEATGFCNAIASLGEADEQTRGFGTMLASTFAPGFATRSGLTSSATHIEERPGLIHAVLDAAGAEAQRVRDDEPIESLLENTELRRLGALAAIDAEGRLSGVITLDAVGRALRDAVEKRAGEPRT